MSRPASRRLPRPVPAALLGAFVLLALLGCGGTASPEAAGPPPAATASPSAPRSPQAAAQPEGFTPEARRIVFLGDSITAGFGLPEADAFPALIEAALRARGLAVEALNAGVSGDTSAGGLSRLDWVLRGGADVVVVELGANDALRGQSLENTARNLRAIVERAREAGARVLLLGMDVPANYGPDYGGGFAALYPRLAAELDVPFVPEFIRGVGLDPALMQPDGLHPTAAGHRKLAELLEPHLLRLVEEARGEGEGRDG